MVTFLGPHAYQSPKIYPDLARVPSWNYLAVHCTVSATLVDDPPAKDRLLKKLIGDHEPPYARAVARPGRGRSRTRCWRASWRSSCKSWTLQCKLKLNQHRPESHAALKAGYAQGNEQERELARWMDNLGIGRIGMRAVFGVLSLLVVGGDRRNPGEEAAGRARPAAPARPVRRRGHVARARRDAAAAGAAVPAGGPGRHAAGPAHARRQVTDARFMGLALAEARLRPWRVRCRSGPWW